MLATVRRCGFMLLICATAARGQSFVNWETAPVHPLDMTPDGTKLLLANTADNRLEVFTLTSGTPVWTASVPVGLDPVSVRARSNTEAWVANFISDTVSVVNLSTMNVVATLSVGDEPCDVVFAGANPRAYVSVSGLNQIRRYNPFDFAEPPLITTITGHRPRALATDGTRIYAAIFFSGNRSTVISSAAVSDPSGPAGGQNPDPNTNTTAFNPPIAAGLPPPPAIALILNFETINSVLHWIDEGKRFWDSKVAWQLNHHAVAILGTSLQLLAYAPQTGNIQMAIAYNSGTGTVFLTQDYLRNELRFEEVVDRQFPHFLLGQVNSSGTPVTTVELNQHLFANPPNPAYKTTATPAERALSISDPRGIVWKDTSNCYISGMGSNNVIRTNASGTRLATVAVGQGPTGLANDAARERLYCYNRFDATLSVINTTNDSEILPRISFYDPTPSVIKMGRPLQYDSHQFSQLGQASCNSCHIDGKNDMQAWDVGDPQGSMKAFNQTCSTLAGAGPCNDWHPMKGPVMTQTLQGIVGNGPMHWRGDREDVLAFTTGFLGFLGLPSAPTPSQMQQLSDFIATIRFPPQPNRTMIDGLPASVSGYSGTPANGAALFYGLPINGSQFQCLECHSLPTGGGMTIIPPNLLGTSQGLKTPQLRDLYTRTGFSKTSQSNNRGFGYSHDGTFESIFEFLQGHFVTYPNNASGDTQRRDLEAFLVCFSTGTHPAVGVQITIDATNNSDASVISLLGTMTSLADSGAVGLVAKGVVGGLPRGYIYQAGTGNCQSDRKSQVVSVTTLRTGAATGAEITFTVVPAGTQTRIGIDRDEDGWYDRDELDLNTNPADPNSKPADSDGDGVADAVDLCPNTIPDSPVDSTGCPPVIFGDFDHDGDVDATDLAIFKSCAGYAGVPHNGTSACVSVDWEHDGDVDPDDYGIFQRCYSGANHPAIPSCSN